MILYLWESLSLGALPLWLCLHPAPNRPYPLSRKNLQSSLSSSLGASPLTVSILALRAESTISSVSEKRAHKMVFVPWSSSIMVVSAPRAVSAIPMVAETFAVTFVFVPRSFTSVSILAFRAVLAMPVGLEIVAVRFVFVSRVSSVMTPVTCLSVCATMFVKKFALFISLCWSPSSMIVNA